MVPGWRATEVDRPAGTSGFHGRTPIILQQDPADSAPMIGCEHPYIGIEAGGGECGDVDPASHGSLFRGPQPSRCIGPMGEQPLRTMKKNKVEKTKAC